MIVNFQRKSVIDDIYEVSHQDIFLDNFDNK